MGSFEETLDLSHVNPVLANGHSDVNCDPPSRIDVLIVGAGVGGLVAALECHRKGHNVRIWERSESPAAGGEVDSRCPIIQRY
jgi:ribulose 1,5-bisphosphate synthetase/thiazole synthase